MAKKIVKTEKYRSAVTGQYVTKSFADNNKKTTVKETDKKKKK